MRIARVTKEGRRPSPETYPPVGSSGPAATSIFIGEVETQGIVGDDESRDLRVIEVHFKHGARNRMHVHSTDQLLVITEGVGIVATEKEERQVHPGDVAFIPANEPHWHGAAPGREMTHLAVNGHGSETKVLA